MAPVLVMAAVPLLYRQAIREGDLGLFALLVWALVLRLAASMVGYYIAFGVYGGVADAHRYLDDGAAVADNFRHLIFSPGSDDGPTHPSPRCLSGQCRHS